MIRSTLLVLFVTCTFACLCTAAPAKKEESKEEEVKLADCPKEVQETLKKAAAGGKITEIEKETKGTVVTYEADVIIDGDEYEVTVAEDGKLLGKKLEVDDDDDDGEDDDD